VWCQVEKWQDARKKDVRERLAAVNESLKAYGHVNKKALEQHGAPAVGGPVGGPLEV
jgi:chromosome segregation ATPase